MILYCLLAFALLWIIVLYQMIHSTDSGAAVKIQSKGLLNVVPLHDEVSGLKDVVHDSLSHGGADAAVADAAAQHAAALTAEQQIIKRKEYETRKIQFRPDLTEEMEQQRYSDKGAAIGVPSLPQTADWRFIRSDTHYNPIAAGKASQETAADISTGKRFYKPIPLQGVKYRSKGGASSSGLQQSSSALLDKNRWKSASSLQWPPVDREGRVPVDDGADVMPIINITVPRFWEHPEGTDINTVGSKVHGQETIFLMIASYRDFQCRETITSAFQRADHPERLFVGAVDQVVPGDVGCLDIDIPCSQDPNQMICKYRDQISVYKMDASKATGPVTARHIGDRMYRGQYFVMQMDAHCYFINHWDKLIIDQWRSTGNEMAVLTSYLSDVQGSISPAGDSTRNTRPIMCMSDYEGALPARYLRHGQQPEDVPVIKDMPQLEPYWAAGFSFSRGHFKMRVPYDAYQPMVFQGEEIGIGIRGFTHGYDFYAPRDSVVFHEYAVNSKRRKKIHLFWDDIHHAGMGQKSLKRATAVIGMAPDLDPSEWDHNEMDRYGLGKVRDVSLFYKIFLIDTVNRKATVLCPFVKSGIMHREFTKYLREDGLGIDYSTLGNFDTKSAIESHLVSQHPYWKKALEGAMRRKSKTDIIYCLENAQRIHLDQKEPQLIAGAQKILQTLNSP